MVAGENPSRYLKKPKNEEVRYTEILGDLLEKLKKLDKERSQVIEEIEQLAEEAEKETEDLEREITSLKERAVELRELLNAMRARKRI
jgi:phenylalanyl-tRNA synthetase alpha subunit